jgi:hypothetical protein
MALIRPRVTFFFLLQGKTLSSGSASIHWTTFRVLWRHVCENLLRISDKRFFRLCRHRYADYSYVVTTTQDMLSEHYNVQTDSNTLYMMVSIDNSNSVGEETQIHSVKHEQSTSLS